MPILECDASARVILGKVGSAPSPWANVILWRRYVTCRSTPVWGAVGTAGAELAVGEHALICAGGTTPDRAGADP